MRSSDAPVVERMQSLITSWENAGDQRAIFLRCYQMMTRNMLSALDEHEFHDEVWVDRLLHRFADYYFVALDAYEQDPVAAPAVWQLAHSLCGRAGTLSLQKLMAGVNAHINYDLVLSLVDLLHAEWAGLSVQERAARYEDHCRVNEVIARSIDAVQDQVLEPDTPLLDVVDKLLGPLDEMLASRLIAHWREQVWENAVRLLDTGDPVERAHLLKRIEDDALRIGETIGRTQWESRTEGVS